MLHFRGYTKLTDAKRYLNPKSFHPRFVFDSIPFSQLLRTIRNNSKEETKTIEIDECVREFINSGYNAEEIAKLKEKATSKTNNVRDDTEEEDTIVFPLHFFDKLKEFKSVVYGLEREIKELIGETRVMFAIKKKTWLHWQDDGEEQRTQHERKQHEWSEMQRTWMYAMPTSQQRTIINY